jgi:NTE family protein
MANKKHLHKNDWGRSVFIDSLDVNTTDFDLPDTKIKDLIESGGNGVKKHFNWRDSLDNHFPI